MALIDIGRKIGSAAGAAANMAKQAAEHLPDNVKNVAGDVKEKINDIAASKNAEKTAPIESESTDKSSSVANVSSEGAMMIMYYIMAADGVLQDEELEQFKQICDEIDPEAIVDRKQLTEHCEQHLSKADEDDHYDYVQDGVEYAIYNKSDPSSFITPKMLLWDMLLIAYSNGEYADYEKKLIKYVARKYDIDKSLLLEMENTLLTVSDIDKELSWVKVQNRPYLEIEKIVNELNTRKQNILEGVKALVML